MKKEFFTTYKNKHGIHFTLFYNRITATYNNESIVIYEKINLDKFDVKEFERRKEEK